MQTFAKYLTPERQCRRRKLDALPILLMIGIAQMAVASDKRQSLESIIDAARSYSLTVAAKQGRADATVTTGRLDARLRLAACDSTLETFSNQPTQPQRNFSVGVRCKSPVAWTIYVPVTLTWQTSVVALKAAKARGAILAEDDLKIIRREVQASYVPHLEQLDDAVGKALTRSLAAGTLLTTAMVSNRQLVRRGERVTLVVERGGLRVTSSGTAESDGAFGDKVLVKNAFSSRRVEGNVMEDGSVRVIN